MEVSQSCQSNWVRGLAVLSASDIAIPAFIASVIGSADLTLKVLPSSQAGNTGSNVVDYIRYVSQ
jgi:hypothetical protein